MHSRGQYGLEIWFDLELPFVWDERYHPLYFKASFFQIVHSDPRRMLLRCDAKIWSFWIFAFHAPHSGHSQQTKEMWWHETSSILEQHLDSEYLFVLADANATPGTYDGRAVQSDGFPTTANTGYFRDLLQQYDLFLPSTTPGYHKHLDALQR